MQELPSGFTGAPYNNVWIIVDLGIMELANESRKYMRGF
jgi:hypothetical protein